MNGTRSLGLFDLTNNNKISIYFPKYLIYFFLISIINYIFYFRDLSTIDVFLILVIFIILMLLSFTFSNKGIIELWIWLFVLYPKKTIGIEYANSFLEGYLINFENINFSFFLFAVIPIYICSYIVNSLKNKKKILHLFVFAFLFLVQILILDTFKGNIDNQYFMTTVLFSIQFLVVIILNDNLLTLSKLKAVLFKTVFLLNTFFIIELTLALLSIINPSNSLDFRDGFRSIFIGFSVEVGFWAMIGTFVGLERVFKEKKLKYIFFILITIIIQFATFDRGNLFVSFLLIIIYLFKFRRRLFIIISSIGFIFSSYFINLLTSSALFKLKMVLDSAKGIYSDSLLDIIGLNSIVYRFYVQLSYLDRILDNLFLPSGFFTNTIRDNPYLAIFFNYDSSIYIDFDFENQESHSLFIQLFFELGLIICVLLFFYSIYKVKKFKLNFTSKTILFALVLFFIFQSNPKYSFVFVSIYGVFLQTKSVNKLA